MTRILALGDLHLGAGAQHRADALADHETILDLIVDLAVERRVDLVLNSGDTFDRPHPSVRAQHVWQRFTRRLEERGIPMISVLGSAGHDQVNSATETAAELAEGRLHRVSRHPEVITEFAGVAVCTLPAVPVHRLVAASDTVARAEINQVAAELLLETARGLQEQAPDLPKVLLGHWSVDAAVLPNGMSVADLHEPVLPLAELERLGFDAQIFGHIHKAQELAWPIFYTGSPLCLSFGEAETEHGVRIIEIGEHTVSSEFVQLEDRRFVTIDVDLADLDRDDLPPETLDPTDYIAAALAEQFPLEDAVVRIRYTASEEQHRRIDAPALRRLCADAGAHRVYQIDPTLIRADRARVPGLDRELNPHAALTAWCEANQVRIDTAHALAGILTESRETASAATAGAAFDPLTLRARNAGRFADLQIDFRDGASVLLGPNGSGKSTVLACLELALYAEDAGDLRQIIAPWAQELEIELTFTLDQAEHRVRRALRNVKRTGSNVPAGGKANLDFERLTPDGWEPVTQETTTATTRALAASLGMSRALFRASCFLAQGDGPAFLTAAPRDRKELAGELLDPLGLWAADKQFVSARAKTLDAELVAGVAKLAVLDETAAQAEALAAEISAALADRDMAAATVTASEGLLEQAQAAEAANAGAAERVKAAAAERDHAAVAVQQARAAAAHASAEAAKLPAAREKLAALETLVARIPQLEQQLEDQRAHLAEQAAAGERVAAAAARANQLRETRDRLKADLDVAAATVRALTAEHERLTQAEDGRERCAICSQILGAEARAAATLTTRAAFEEASSRYADKEDALGAASREAQAAADALAALPQPQQQEPLEDFAGPLTEARAAVERVAAGRHVIQGIEELAGQVDFLNEVLREAARLHTETEAALTAAAAGVKDTAELAANVSHARQIVASRRRTLDAHTASVATLEERHGRTLAAAREATHVRAAAAEAQALLDVLRVAERAFGRDGIPVLLLETVLPQIDAEANAILRRFPTADGWTFSVRFETQREQTSSDRVREELYVMVTAPDYDQDFRTLSGGEESRVSFAVRVALAILLGRVRGADSRLLVLDELPFLDEQAEATLVDLVNELVADGTFSKVLMVSHSPGVRDAFAEAIEIEKLDGVSAIAGAREKVLA